MIIPDKKLVPDSELKSNQVQHLLMSLYAMLGDAHVTMLGDEGLPDMHVTIYNVFYHSPDFNSRLSLNRKVDFLQAKLSAGIKSYTLGHRPHLEGRSGKKLGFDLMRWELSTGVLIYWQPKRCLPYMKMDYNYQVPIKYMGHPLIVRGWQVLLPSEMRRLFGKEE